MTLAKTRPEGRPEPKPTEDDAVFNAAWERAFPDPMPGATDEERRRELDRLLQVGIDELDRNEGIVLRTDEDHRRFHDDILSEVLSGRGVD